jgi:hypothetical protein
LFSTRASTTPLRNHRLPTIASGDTLVIKPDEKTEESISWLISKFSKNISQNKLDSRLKMKNRKAEEFERVSATTLEREFRVGGAEGEHLKSTVGSLAGLMGGHYEDYSNRGISFKPITPPQQVLGVGADPTYIANEETGLYTAIPDHMGRGPSDESSDDEEDEEDPGRSEGSGSMTSIFGQMKGKAWKSSPKGIFVISSTISRDNTAGEEA